MDNLPRARFGPDRRYTAEEALAVGIVDQAVPDAQVLPAAIERAVSVATKDRKVIAQHKRMLLGDAARTCGVTP